MEKEWKFKLIIFPAPISNRYKKDLLHLNKSEISHNVLDYEFKDYFQKILILMTVFLMMVHIFPIRGNFRKFTGKNIF
jgi:hypothetical protein